MQSGWDGIEHTADKQFKSLSIRVAEALKRVESEHVINLDQLEYMSHNRAEIFLKGDYSSMSTTRRQKIGSKTESDGKRNCLSTSNTFGRRIDELRG